MKIDDYQMEARTVGSIVVILAAIGIAMISGSEFSEIGDIIQGTVGILVLVGAIGGGVYYFKRVL